MSAAVANGTAKENGESIADKKRAMLSETMESRIDALGAGENREYLWGCELNKEQKEVTWTYGAGGDEEGDDTDFLVHTLYLRHAVLGVGAAKDDRNVVSVETKTFQGDMIKIPIATLKRDHKDMCIFDLNFGHDMPVTFRLLEGDGPVHLVAQHAVEWPREENEFITEDTATETETEDEPTPKKKRKASSSPRKGLSKRGRLDTVEEENDDVDETEESDEEEESMEEDEDEEEEEEEESEEEEEEEESEEEVPKKKGKGKAKAAPAKTKKAPAKATKSKAKPAAKGKGKKK